MTNLTKVPGRDAQLSRSQQAIVDLSNDTEYLSVQGCAGSGKSAVLLARLKKFAKNTDESILLLVYTLSLKYYFNEILKSEDIPEGRVTVCTLDSVIGHIYDEIDGPPVNIISDGKKGDSIRIELMEKTIREVREKPGIIWPSRFDVISIEFWLSECHWMYSMGVNVEEPEEYYFNLERKGRGRDIRFTRNERSIVFEIYSMYNHLLLNHGEYSLGRKKRVGWCERDFKAIYVLGRKNRIPAHFKFDHVFIDEAQDFTKTKIMLALNLHKKDMVVAMDNNQCVFGKKWSLSTLKPGCNFKTKKLQKTFRCSKSIDAFAESLRAHNDPVLDEGDLVEHVVPNTPDGPLPKVVCCTDRGSEGDYIVEKIFNIRKNHPDQVIGVLCATNMLCQTIGLKLRNAGIDAQIYVKDGTLEMLTPGVKVITVFSAKGLEFNTVFMPYFDRHAYDRKKDKAMNDEYNELKIRDTLYVGMTRAITNLFITYSSDSASKYLNQVDSSLYEYIDLTEENPEPPCYEQPVYTPVKISEESETKDEELPEEFEDLPVVTEAQVTSKLEELNLSYFKGPNDIIYIDTHKLIPRELGVLRKNRMEFKSKGGYWQWNPRG